MKTIITRTVISILFLGFIVGCAPKPYVEIYMEPQPSENAIIDERTGAITVEKEGVEITLKPLDEAELFEITEDPDINPYVDVERWGNVVPIYTVFSIHVKNNRESRVVIGPLAIMIDENGDQYASLPYDYFKDLYGKGRIRHTEVIHRPLYYRPYYWWRPYRYHYYRHYRWHYPYGYYYRPDYVRRYVTYEDPHLLRLTARETVFDGAKLFSGAKRDGLLVFEKLDEGATDVRVVIPEVEIYEDKELKEKIDFHFNLRQIVSVREE